MLYEVITVIATRTIGNCDGECQTYNRWCGIIIDLHAIGIKQLPGVFCFKNSCRVGKRYYVARQSYKLCERRPGAYSFAWTITEGCTCNSNETAAPVV